MQTSARKCRTVIYTQLVCDGFKQPLVNLIEKREREREKPKWDVKTCNGLGNLGRVGQLQGITPSMCKVKITSIFLFCRKKNVTLETLALLNNININDIVSIIIKILYSSRFMRGYYEFNSWIRHQKNTPTFICDFTLQKFWFDFHLKLFKSKIVKFEFTSFNHILTKNVNIIKR